MAVYNIHAGHNRIVPGAAKYLNEVTEDRKVKDYVIQYLRAAGHTVYDCTDDSGRTKNANLANIVKKCNKHSVAYDVSIHLNAGGGTGVEVWNYDSRTKAVSDRVCKNVAAALGIKNRGTKYNKSFYVLRNTKSLAFLVECAFVDNTTDKKHWNAQKCGKAIAEGILGKTISGSVPVSGGGGSTAKNPSPSGIDVKYRSYCNGWLSEIINCNTSNSKGYAGVIGKNMTALQANTVGNALKVGKLKYRFHELGSDWFAWQTDREKDKCGENYAGNKKKAVDKLQMILEGASGYQVEYQA